MQFLPPTWVDSIASTNTALLEQLDAGQALPSGTVLATDNQTAGRGQGVRQWQTTAGRDLACSFVLRAPVEMKALCSLSMAVALGVVDLLEGLGLQASTKWPNDVVVASAQGLSKICGILAELPGTASATSRPVVVVGVGLNVGMTHTTAVAIDQPATSVFIETGEARSARALLPELLAALAPRLEKWSTDGFAALRPDWELRCVGLTEPVTIVDGAHERRGVLAGFGDAGQLLLSEDGAHGPAVDVWSGHLRLASRT